MNDEIKRKSDFYSGLIDKNFNQIKEFYDYSFTHLDRNKDGNLDNNEWKYGHDNFYGSSGVSSNFEEYDGDGNANLSQEEYMNSFSDSDYFKSYDTNKDNYIDTNELNLRTYQDLDKNRDGILDQNEFKENRSLYFDN